MANNEVFDGELKLAVVASAPASPTSGAPCRYGNLTGVALTDKRTADNLTPIDFGFTAWSLSVKGINDSGNSAVAVGDPLFFVDADTPNISKKSSGYFFGIAMGVVTTGSTTTITVLHIPTAGTVPAGSVNTAALAANAVTAAKVSATMGIGIMPLSLADWIWVDGTDIPVKATKLGGKLCKDTDPIFERVNGATDIQHRLRWAAASVIPIEFDLISPPDLDNTSPVNLKLWAAMGGATDHPVTVGAFFEGVGGSNVGGNFSAMAGGTTPAVYTLPCTVTAVAGTPKPWTITLTPGTHATDTFLIYQAWLEYARK